MDEGFAKKLKRCRWAHFVTGGLNILVMIIAVLAAMGVYVLVNWVPQVIDSDLYTEEQRVAFKDAYPKLMAVVGLMMVFPVIMAVLTFFSFHVAWCLKRGRYYRYCQIASWIQGLNAPLGTPSAVMAIALLKSDECKAHFGIKVKPAEESLETED